MTILKATKAKVLFLTIVLVMCPLFVYMYLNKDTDSTRRFTEANQIQNKNPDKDKEISNELTTQEIQYKEISEEHLKSNDTADYSFDFIDEKIFAKSEYILERMAFEAKYSDPRDFVKLKWRNGIPREIAIRIFTKDNIPLLHEMIKDPGYAPYWHNVAMLICHISDDPDSVPVLSDYFQRYDEQQSRINYPSKVGCIIDIGRIAKQEATDFLRKAITEKGAIELAQAWIDKSSPGDYMGRQEAIEKIRLYAMQGLIFTGIKENIELIENIYEKENDIFKNTGEASGEFFDSAGALAIRDYILDNGLDALRNVQSGDGSDFLSAISRYLHKYIDFNEMHSTTPKESKN